MPLPRQQMILLGALAAAAVIGTLSYFIIKNRGEQQSTQDQLDALKKQIAAATASAPPSTRTPDLVMAPSSAPPGTMAALDKQRTTSEIMAEGQRLLDSGDPLKIAKAVELFQEALDKVDPKNTDFFNGLGRAYLLSRHFPEATQVYHKALEISPKRADLWDGIASAYWGVKDFFHAKVAYEQALELDPNNIQAWSIMAWVYMALKQQDKSTHGFQVLLVSAPDRDDWIKGLAMARAGNTQVEQIRAFFPLPDPPLLLTPPSTAGTIPSTSVPANKSGN